MNTPTVDEVVRVAQRLRGAPVDLEAVRAVMVRLGVGVTLDEIEAAVVRVNAGDPYPPPARPGLTPTVAEVIAGIPPSVRDPLPAARAHRRRPWWLAWW